MKTLSTLAYAAGLFFLLPNVLSAQVPTLGTTAYFALFSSIGALSNTGISLIKGNVGTNSGSSTNFGPIDGMMHDQNGVSSQAATDLLVAHNQLNATTATAFPAPLLGSGQVLEPGVYSIASAATLNLVLTLDGKGDANAVFIFKTQGAFSTGALASVLLINGASACNVFWKVEGLVSLATGTSMKGTILANNGAIVMYTGVILEGRALSTTGAITVASVNITPPANCGTGVVTDINALEMETAQVATISPNPFYATPITIHFKGSVGNNTEWKVYDVSGKVVMTELLRNSNTTLETEGLLPVLYVYKLFRNGTAIQSGRLISQ